MHRQIKMVSRNDKTSFEVMRSLMVANQLISRDITDKRVLEVMGSVPREEFVPSKYSQEAYEDYPVPIGLGQTISQPYMVALMSQWLEVEENHDVLEIGTGCGYQTAVLASLARKVYTIEVLHGLQEQAQTTLVRLGYDNVEFYIGDGSLGWPDEREFDRIIVTAAAPQLPGSLVSQLAERGKIVIPVGSEFIQELIVAEKKDNNLYYKPICGCRFVKLIGKEGFEE